jgi:hypothetical protein
MRHIIDEKTGEVGGRYRHYEVIECLDGPHPTYLFRAKTVDPNYNGSGQQWWEYFCWPLEFLTETEAVEAFRAKRSEAGFDENFRKY